ncbi:MAG: hypothetical protein JW894_09780 [Bacteroidales bacterium]|nr:hypothetical protein [Bacteroidales bacterium]
MRNPAFIIFLLFVISGFTNAKVKNVGFSFVQNYTTDQYNAATQNWAIAQDKNGLMYFGNNEGLLVFDGSGWRTYSLPNSSVIRSIIIDKDGKIYIGAFNEFGSYSYNREGHLSYKSLMNKIPIEQRNFGEVWNIEKYKNGLIFHSFNKVLFYVNDTVEVISSDRDLSFSHIVNDIFYIKQPEKGLLKLTNGRLKLVKGSEICTSLPITGILPYVKDKLLIATREKGLFVFDENGGKPFNSQVQKHLIANQIYCVAQIDENTYALGTVQDGLVIIDEKGNLVQHINRSRGLQNNTILSIFVDKSKNLWLGLDNGIDYVLLNSPLGYYEHQNIIGSAYDMVIVRDNLYIGTNQGLFTSKWPGTQYLAGDNSGFQLIDGSQGQVWTIAQNYNLLWIGHDKGTFLLENGTLKNVGIQQGGWAYADVPGKSGFVIGGTYSGLTLYELSEGENGSTLKSAKPISDFNVSCKQIQFDNNSSLWMGHSYLGVFQIKFNSAFDSITDIKRYTVNDGLPSTYQLNVLKFNNQVLISTEKGIYLFDYLDNSFKKSESLTDLFDNRNIHSLIEDKNGNTWFFSSQSVGILKPNFDGSYSKEIIPFMPLSKEFIAGNENILQIDQSNLLFSSVDGLLHFDPSFRKNYSENYSVLIRKVICNNDSVIFDGQTGLPDSCCYPASINYDKNALRFIFTAAHYEWPEQITYSYFLEGFDNGWSEWNFNEEKEYTNLKEGAYSFHVKARNVYGHIQKSVPFSFIILPPWYRSTFAYIIYAILFAVFIFFIVLFLVRRIEREKQTLKVKQKEAIDAKEKNFAAESLKAEQEIIKLRNEKLEAENQINKAMLEGKTKELASIAMQITYKNELLTQIKQKLSKVSNTMIHRESKQQVDSLIKTLERDIVGQDDWEKFEVHFDQVHEDFLKKLRKNYPELTPKDLKLCAYLRMNLSSKEIAPLLNISIRGIEISRYRLRKKLYLNREANLTDFMMNL